MIKNSNKINDKYFVYVLRCNDSVLYTGITIDVKRRFMEHKGIGGLKNGAKFTKSHVPEEVVAVWKTDTRSNASKLEARIKKLKKSEKELLIDDNKNFKTFFGETVDISNYKRVRVIK